MNLTRQYVSVFDCVVTVCRARVVKLMKMFLNLHVFCLFACVFLGCSALSSLWHWRGWSRSQLANLDTSPVHHRADTRRQTTIQTHRQFRAINLPCVSLEYRRKLEHPKEMGWILHTERHFQTQNLLAVTNCCVTKYTNNNHLGFLGLYSTMKHSNHLANKIYCWWGVVIICN